MADLVGQQFGNYLLIQHLGQGGFADVYLGEHQYLKTQAAIKVMHTLVSGPDQQDFLQEAQLLAALKHAHIVPIIDFGIQAGIPFLVMVYAPHGSLRYDPGTRLPLTTVLAYVTQIAAALQHIHDHKRIHRDVKPANLLLGPNNQIWLSDLGIAVIARASISASIQDVRGTPAYMAPEQGQGKAQPASDQYALGVIVYEWLSGELPFQGSTHELLSQHLYTSPPPLRQKASEIPPSVEKVIMQALEKDPARRFAHVTQFAEALVIATQLTEPAFNPPLPHVAMSAPVLNWPSAKLPQVQPSSLQPQQQQQLQQQQILQTPQASSSASSPLWGSTPSTMADVLYLRGINATDPEMRVFYWDQIPKHDPNYKGGTFAPLLKETHDKAYQHKVRRLHNEAQTYAQNKDWQMAVNKLMELSKEVPKDSQAQQELEYALRALALQATDAANLEQAIWAWQSLLRRKSSASQAEQHLRALAEQVSNRGAWKQEISIWEELLKVKPDDAQALRRLPVAMQNDKYAWHYDNARQCFMQGNVTSALEELNNTWRDASYYGDPDGLAQKLGMASKVCSPADIDREYEEAATAREKQIAARFKASKADWQKFWLIFSVAAVFFFISGLSSRFISVELFMLLFALCTSSVISWAACIREVQIKSLLEQYGTTVQAKIESRSDQIGNFHFITYSFTHEQKSHQRNALASGDAWEWSKGSSVAVRYLPEKPDWSRLVEKGLRQTIFALMGSIAMLLFILLIVIMWLFR